MKYLKTYEERKYIEHRILKMMNSLFIFSIYKEEEDLYVGLITYCYDNKGLIKIKIPPEKDNSYNYDDFLKKGTDNITVYKTTDLKDALETVEIMWNKEKYNL